MIIDPNEAGISYPIFDIHHHIGSRLVGAVRGSETAIGVPEAEGFDGLVARRIAYMDRFGIDQACILAASSFRLAPTSSMNAEVAQWKAARPDRFPVGIGVVDVTSRDGGLGELAYMREQLGLDGVMWHHRFQGSYLDDPLMSEALRCCASISFPVFVHVVSGSTLESPWRFLRLADAYPDVRFIALDGFSSPEHSLAMREIAKRVGNVTFDTGVLVSAAHGLAEFIVAVGAERLVLGTDLYLSPPTYFFPYAISEVAHLPIPPESKRVILARNALQIFGLA